MRFLEFTPEGEVLNRKIILDISLKRRLNENLLLFFTGITRRADSVLKEQKENINGRLSTLRAMKQMAYTALDALETGELDMIGHLLHESWQLKKQMASKISNDTLDEMYKAARKAGAFGGKITGAGGGGFLLPLLPTRTSRSCA